MGFSLTSPAPEKSDPTAKNRVWGFFGETPQSHRENRYQPKQPRQGDPSNLTKTVSGRTYWPSRDPIRESGGINMYGMDGNAPVNLIDILGRDTVAHYQMVEWPLSAKHLWGQVDEIEKKNLKCAGDTGMEWEDATEGMKDVLEDLGRGDLLFTSGHGGDGPGVDAGDGLVDADADGTGIFTKDIENAIKSDRGKIGLFFMASCCTCDTVKKLVDSGAVKIAIGYKKREAQGYADGIAGDFLKGLLAGKTVGEALDGINDKDIGRIEMCISYGPGATPKTTLADIVGHDNGWPDEWAAETRERWVAENGPLEITHARQ